MTSKLYRPIPLLLLVAAVCNPIAWSQTKARKAPPSPPHIKLVLGIVIDQFRYDYLTRFGDQFGPGGFRRLLDGGAVFTNANYPYTPTVTACGHSVFMTGAAPSENGIVANEWYDRESKQKVTSVNDPNTRLLGGTVKSGSSPHRLLSSTIGDQLKLHTNGLSRVIGISLKDRSAILPAGKMAEAAYWYDEPTGKMVSSTYYFADLPAWVKKFNLEQGTDTYFGRKWERLLPASSYRRSQPDDSPLETWQFGNVFPHLINGGEAAPGARFYKQFEATPFANDMLVALAKSAIENEQLGADEIPDLLTVSFSANDLQGHSTGPYSQEMQDMTLRTDRAIADLLNYIDRKIGLANTVIALTADHGVAPVPEQMEKYGIGGRMSEAEVRKAAEQALSNRFGDQKYIAAMTYGNIYFDYPLLDRMKVSRELIEQTACNAVSSLRGIAGCFTRSDIVSGRLPRTRVANSVALGYNPARNGDLVIVQKPFWLVSGDTDSTTHSTPYSYDTHVPILLYGAGINHGSFSRSSSPLDIAPTIAEILKIELPSNSVGQILSEAIKR